MEAMHPSTAFLSLRIPKTSQGIYVYCLKNLCYIPTDEMWQPILHCHRVVRLCYHHDIPSIVCVI
jgi:hypothetical protein